MSLVIDSSVVLALKFGPEALPNQTTFIDRLGEEQCVVPALWFAEVANALLVLTRQHGIEATTRETVLADLRDLDILVDAESTPRAWAETLRIAQEYDLSVYDAAYLELALRRALPLATVDAELSDAAQAAGVELLP